MVVAHEKRMERGEGGGGARLIPLVFSPFSLSFIVLLQERAGDHHTHCDGEQREHESRGRDVHDVSDLYAPGSGRVCAASCQSPAHDPRTPSHHFI